MNKWDDIMEGLFFLLFVSFIITSIFYLEKQLTDINNIECYSAYCYEER